MPRKPIQSKTVKQHEEKKKARKLIQSVQGGIANDDAFFNELPPPDSTNTVSTGSLLLDLTIGGKRSKWGGVPSGIIMEVFGPSGAGKTSILAEMCGSAIHRGGTADIQDPEARLDKEYSTIYGVNINPEIYSRPDTVDQIFERIWSRSNIQSPLHVWGIDSLAALSTKLEMETADKMGMRRAKEFSEGLRKTCRMVANNPWTMVCTNQVRQSEHGETVPGGNAFPFYSTIRLRVAPTKDWQVIKKVKFNNKEFAQVKGIKSKVVVKKNSYDEPFRECVFFIIFGYGIHDIMTNLQFLKDTLGCAMYPTVDKEYQSLEQAVSYIEKQGLELQVREEVRQVWNELQQKFHIERKPKVRF